MADYWAIDPIHHKHLLIIHLLFYIRLSDWSRVTVSTKYQENQIYYSFTQNVNLLIYQFGE
jgi:hypothetical protein